LLRGVGGNERGILAYDWKKRGHYHEEHEAHEDPRSGASRINERRDVMAKRRRDGNWEEPEALRHLRRTLTEQMALKAFREAFGRPPEPGELEVFVENYTLEMYNGGFDEWPEEDAG
jgi:hypothetical protein